MTPKREITSPTWILFISIEAYNRYRINYGRNMLNFFKILKKIVYIFLSWQY